jgi:hypothetical protein
MSNGYQQPQRPPPAPSPQASRVDLGRTRTFTGPNTDDNRGDGFMSFHQDQAGLQSQQNQYDPYGWMGGYGGYDPYGYGGGYGGYYGGYDPFGYGSYNNATSSYYGGATQGEEKWGEVEQTTLSHLEEAGAVREYGEESVLVIANGPEDMRQLDHNAEAQMIANAMGEGRNAVVLWNPSAEALQAMLKNGQFKDVVLSGHGAEGTVFMTGADGESVAVDGQTFAGYFNETGVQNVFLNMCHGAGGQASVAESLAVAGMNVMGWQTTVKDSDAVSASGVLGSMLADGTSLSDMTATAATNSNLSVIAAGGTQANATTPAATPVAETAPAAAVTPAAETAPAVVTPEVGAGGGSSATDSYYGGGYDVEMGRYMVGGGFMMMH